jgi:hypothetical protein
MFEDVAKKLLTLMGNTGTVPGAILVDDISQALSRLSIGIKKASQNIQVSTKQDDENEEPEVSLAHRAIPLINMLKAAQKNHCNVMWE